MTSSVGLSPSFSGPNPHRWTHHQCDGSFSLDASVDAYNTLAKVKPSHDVDYSDTDNNGASATKLLCHAVKGTSDAPVATFTGTESCRRRHLLHRRNSRPIAIPLTPSPLSLVPSMACHRCHLRRMVLRSNQRRLPGLAAGESQAITVNYGVAITALSLKLLLHQPHWHQRRSCPRQCRFWCSSTKKTPASPSLLLSSSLASQTPMATTSLSSTAHSPSPLAMAKSLVIQ